MCTPTSIYLLIHHLAVDGAALSSSIQRPMKNWVKSGFITSCQGRSARRWSTTWGCWTLIGPKCSGQSHPPRWSGTPTTLNKSQNLGFEIIIVLKYNFRIYLTNCSGILCLLLVPKTLLVSGVLREPLECIPQSCSDLPIHSPLAVCQWHVFIVQMMNFTNNCSVFFVVVL